MMHGRNNGKKLMAVRIVAHAFEIVRPPTVAPHDPVHTNFFTVTDTCALRST
jgi:ribosomal protein S7